MICLIEWLVIPKNAWNHLTMRKGISNLEWKKLC